MAATCDLPPAHTLYTPRQRWGFLAILFLVSTSSYMDRQIITIVLEPIKDEFRVSDARLGLLTGFSFAIFYATLGLPVARLADRANRRVIIGVALTVWSTFTVLCGFAQGFWQLAAARIGVGAGESGAIPPSQSLVADYFPPEQRGRALGLLMMSAMAGYLVAFVGGSQVAAAYGWRAAFIFVGVPGLALALLVFLGLSEPRTLPGRAVPRRGGESIADSWRALRAKPGFTNLSAAMILYFFVSYGAVMFFPSFMMRVYGEELARVGLVFGAMSAVASVAGSILGGWAVDRLCARDRRWMCWLPGALLLATAPLQIIALLMPSFLAFVLVCFPPSLAIAALTPSLFTHLHAICGSPRRAASVAFMFFFANLIGLGIGPIVAGALSDHFTALQGPSGIRWSLVIVVLLFLPAGGLMLRAARSLETDIEP
ncbi:spinster family MFS transporter [Erythrobacter sp. NE805]|uniref:spinster family MFS transporter n=1 Tax=Erythrobacter sp. NE805 TaxID=3389875 RepID=UPI00396B0029